MRARGIAKLYVHTATVQTCTGTNGYGEDTFSDPVTLDPADVSTRASGNGCLIDDTSRLVRSADGEQVVSDTTIYTYPDNAALFSPNSIVTWPGRAASARVIKANTNTAPGLNLPEHVAVTLE